MNSEEINALKNVVEYLREEEQDAEEAQPSHIWQSVKVLNRYLDDLTIRTIINIIAGVGLGLFFVDIFMK